MNNIIPLGFNSNYDSRDMYNIIEYDIKNNTLNIIFYDTNETITMHKDYLKDIKDLYLKMRNPHFSKHELELDDIKIIIRKHSVLIEIKNTIIRNDYNCEEYSIVNVDAEAKRHMIKFKDDNKIKLKFMNLFEIILDNNNVEYYNE